jgi:hypothetical protein
MPQAEKNVLLVLSKQDTTLRNELEELLYNFVDAAGAQVVVTNVRDIEDCHAAVSRSRIDVIVIGSFLARNPQSARSEDGGIVLCEELKKRDIASRLLLLVPIVANTVNDVTARCQQVGAVPVWMGTDATNQVRKYVHEWLPPPRVLDVVFQRRPDESWAYELTGNYFQFTRNGNLERLAPYTMGSFAMSTSYIGEVREELWYQAYCKLGKLLIEAMCDSPKFKYDLLEGVQLAGGFQHVRISFSFAQVDRSHYPIALEALFPPADPAFAPEPWAVHAPLYRSVAQRRPCAQPLFRDTGGKLKVLLIGADCSGIVDGVTDQSGRPLRLNPLSTVARECEWLHRYLSHESRASFIETPRLLDGFTRPLGEGELMKALAEPWDVIHFAGHAFAKEEGEQESRGYIFVGSPGKPERIAIERLAPYLGKARLVYLSSCSSSSPAFALELAQNGVPIVIGFRWKVDDRCAMLHACTFYRKLIRERRVELAFQKTRRAIHRHHTKDKVWASSMLVFGDVA